MLKNSVCVGSCLSVCVPNTYRCPWKIEESAQIPEVTGGCKLPTWVLGTELRSREEQQELLSTQPRLQLALWHLTQYFPLLCKIT